MTVGELKEKLSALPDDTEILLNNEYDEIHPVNDAKVFRAVDIKNSFNIEDPRWYFSDADLKGLEFEGCNLKIGDDFIFIL